tara:strand:- start:5229 stop:5720 length:492 start_codon:yes stop_codon:yes gene_type:complete
METKEIKGFEDYLASKDGVIIKKKDNRILPQYKDSNRNRPDNIYMRVNLWVNDKQSTQRVHRLVALAWIDNPNNYKQVDHMDQNKFNNNVDNLRWICNSKNQLNTKDRPSKWGRNITKHEGKNNRWYISFSRNGKRTCKSLPLSTPHEEVVRIRNDMKLQLDM